MDGNIYTSSCHANSYYVEVDYDDVCNGWSNGDHCTSVKCPKLQSEGCTGWYQLVFAVPSVVSNYLD